MAAGAVSSVSTGESCVVNDEYEYERRLFVRHPWHGVSIGRGAPEIIKAVVEVPKDASVKTTLDVETGLLRVDRVLASSMMYPANYGFIPRTLAADGDPLDIMILTQLRIPPLTVVRVRPIGVIPTVDDGKPDDKIIAVPLADPEYNMYTDVAELPPYRIQGIAQFFRDYKISEGHVVRTAAPQTAAAAQRVIQEAADRYCRLRAAQK